ncbi:MAG: EamA family transporter [Clostridia bacterium]|nr:EamA family transporter [Clostridia bacterium]
MVALLIVAASAVGLVEGIAIKKYNKKHDKGGFIFTALISLFSMLFFIITDKGGIEIVPQMLPYSIISGILYCTASLLTFIALKCGSFSISMLILSYSGVFTILYGLIFLREPTSVFAYIGMGIMMISLFLSRPAKAENEKRGSFKWLICITVSLFGSGFFGVMSKAQQIRFENRYNNEYMMLTLAISFVILVTVGIINDRKNLGYILRYGAPYAALGGISNGATNLLALIITSLIAVSISSPLSAGTKIIMSFIVSKLIFKESFLKRQVFGVLLGAVSLVFLNL